MLLTVFILHYEFSYSKETQHSQVSLTLHIVHGRVDARSLEQTMVGQFPRH